jgi:nitrogen fixation/metabolism regulation signal transduction histidine kinase
MRLTPEAYALLGMTAIVAAISAAVVFAVLRFVAAARDSRKQRGSAADTAILSAALSEAVEKLRAQERATAARAEASERMSSEIINSLSAGLLVVGSNGSIRILNPAGRRMLSVPDNSWFDTYRELLQEPVLADLIDECFTTQGPILRRNVTLPASGTGVSHLGVTVSPMTDERG